VRTLLDLLLPLECGGCRAPGTRWCTTCAAELITAEPVALHPRVPGVPPTWATGSYAGARRAAVLAAKERGRRDLAGPLGSALARAVRDLRAWGELDPAELAPLAMVPAPTRRSAARRRGGDPVLAAARVCVACLDDGATVWPVLSTARGARDSVGLNAAQRCANLHGRVQVAGALPTAQANVVLVDDVLTTGATAAAATVALAARGVRVHAVLVVCTVG